MAMVGTIKVTPAMARNELSPNAVFRIFIISTFMEMGGRSWRWAAGPTAVPYIDKRGGETLVPAGMGMRRIPDHDPVRIGVRVGA